MPNPKKLKATGDKNSGYSNTVKSNNTSYISNKDKLYLKLSKMIDISLNNYELLKVLKSDFDKLKKYLPLNKFK
jgi:hypothetical protein